MVSSFHSRLGMIPPCTIFITKYSCIVFCYRIWNLVAWVGLSLRCNLLFFFFWCKCRCASLPLPRFKYSCTWMERVLVLFSAWLLLLFLHVPCAEINVLDYQTR